MTPSIRPWLLRLHRWAGLGLAGLLALEGATGSVLAFQGALDAALNPDLFAARTTGPALSADDLLMRITAQSPGGDPTYLVFRPPPGRTAQAFLSALPGAPLPAENQVFADPATGAVLGRRAYGACCLSRHALVPFLYTLHRSLMAGATGTLVLGIAALVWALDCCAGLALTLPRAPPRLTRWRGAWTLKRRAGAARRELDLHRAGGLWLWPTLLALAVSGVSLALPTQVFRPAVAALLPVTPPGPARPAADAARTRLPLDRLIADAERDVAGHGDPLPATTLYRNLQAGTVAFYFFPEPTLRGTGLGTPSVTLDDSTGAVLERKTPGDGRLGDLFERIQFPLHSGQVAGLPGRVAIAFTGMAVAMLSVTGVMIWARRRRARRIAAARRA